MSEQKKLTTAAGAPVVDNQNVTTAGPRGPALLQDIWFLEKLAPLCPRGGPQEFVQNSPVALTDAPV